MSSVRLRPSRSDARSFAAGRIGLVRMVERALLAGSHVAIALVLLGTVETTVAQAMRPGEPEPAPAASAKAGARPYWRDLTAKQQRTLAPLAPQWDGLAEQHKRKWLAIARNYANLPLAEQEVMQRRMIEWAALSRQERVDARHNFAEVKQLTAGERKAKWEAYQALSEDERRKLAARAGSRPTGASVAIQPVPADRLAPVPPSTLDAQHIPRIQIAPPASAAAATPVRLPTPQPAANNAFPPVSAEAQVPAPSGEPAAPPAHSLRSGEPSSGTP